MEMQLHPGASFGYPGPLLLPWQEVTPKRSKKQTEKTVSVPSSPHPHSHAGLLTVGQTARVLGISPSTLRVWESVGLVTPARSNGRFRLYTPEILEVLKRIKYLRDVKQLSVPGIKEMLGSSNGVPPAPAKSERAELGPKLRQMREKCELSLAEAAQRAKVSAGFLSSIELSRAHPSVATLQRLAAAYGRTVLEFYDLPQRASRLVRPRDRRSLETDNGVRMEVLSFGTAMLECMLIRVPPGAGSDGAYSHNGEDFIFLQAGALEVWLDEIEYYTLAPGDSLWFNSNSGHRWFNPSKEEAVMIWVNTPPTF
jgi:DNA-binding transcriptional MerR regulator/quercetin dioxygenase-like cupin family protein